MAAAVVPPIDDIMDSEPAWNQILQNFGLSARSRNRLTEDYTTARDLIISNIDQIKSVVSTQNKTYRNHATAAQRCYINTAQLNRVLAFYRWSIFAVKDAGAQYDIANVAIFDLNWINGHVDEYLLPDPEVTSQATPFAVTVPRFEGTNWHDVKTMIIALLATRIGNAGIPITYLVRETRLFWEDTEYMSNLQDRRVRTKLHQGITFDLDNTELFRILMNIFATTTLDSLVRAFQTTTNGLGAWRAILANVQGASYNTELKRQADATIEGAFFDPTKNFTFEKYFDKHVRCHELYHSAEAALPEWRKIDLFMKGVRCNDLQNDYRTLKDDPRYDTFTTFYNKLNENYRTMCSQGILKPVSVYKRKLSQMSSDRGRGSRSTRGRGARRRTGRGSQRDGRGRAYGRGPPRGRGRTGRGGRGGRQIDMSNVNMQCLPSNIDLNNLSFSDDQWYGFSHEQRDTITALRQLRNSGGGNNNYGGGNDDMSSLGGSAASGSRDARQIYQLVHLPPVPGGQPVAPPNGESGNNYQSNGSQSNGGARVSNSTRSSDAGSAFGRPT